MGSKKTLTEIVEKNFKKKSIKNLGNERSRKTKNNKKEIIKSGAVNIPSLIKRIILENSDNSQIEDSSRIKKEKDNIDFTPKSEEIGENIGGYGTLRYNQNGTAYSKPYMDYEKLFSHLGKFKSKNAYEETPTGRVNSVMEQDGKFFLIENEVINYGILAMKHRTGGSTASGVSSLPPNGISSSDWEAFKLWTIIEPVMYNLRMKTV